MGVNRSRGKGKREKLKIDDDDMDPKEQFRNLKRTNVVATEREKERVREIYLGSCLIWECEVSDR